MPNTPRQVLLFSGHMMDAPGRPSPRFPPQKEAAAARKIGAALDELNAGADDLALAQGASGGDILFLEACRQRGVRLQLMLPLPEPEFIRQSLLPSINGLKWQERFEAVKTSSSEPPLIMPMEPVPFRHLGPEQQPDDVFARCNLWLLDTALGWGIEKLRFVCLWDGKDGDGPGGTAHMMNLVKRRNGQVIWLDMNRL